MIPELLKPGRFYIQGRNHFVYICDTGRRLVCIGRAYECFPHHVGAIMAPDEPGEASRAWKFLREAQPNEVVRAVTMGANFPVVGKIEIVTLKP